MRDFKKIGIIGIGLIGGSIGLDVKRKKISKKVYGYSRKIETMEKAVKKGIIDQYYKSPEELIKSVDFLIISTPVNVMEDYFKIIRDVKPEIIFTDVASIKKNICDKVRKIIGENANFIGSHPIAGSEKYTVDFASNGLFEGKTVVLTPTENTKMDVREKVKHFWEKLGSRVIYMSPKEHDEILGFTSHLPHFLVYVLLAVGNKNKKCFKNCFGSGFFDTTRIGKSNYQMWTEIFFSNKKNILKWIGSFEKELKKFKEYLIEGNYEKLEKSLEKSKFFREYIENEEKF
ncbi:MAG: prephenate dehydrogenase [Candidatus Omnitrophica bacterium]|nr:prephenate dehydrogenase [Candidatus Omnitrophota bacterium]